MIPDLPNFFLDFELFHNHFVHLHQIHAPDLRQEVVAKKYEALEKGKQNIGYIQC